jgi:hypothetical protein
MDAIVLWELMRGIKGTCVRGAGFLYDVSTLAEWSWDADTFANTQRPLVLRLYGRVLAMLKSLTAFFLLSSVTALVLRVWLTSGEWAAAVCRCVAVAGARGSMLN